MNRILPYVLLVIAVTLGGCTAQQGRDAALAAAHLVALNDQYDHAREIYRANIVKVPEARRAEVERAWAVVELLHARVNAGDVPALAESLALYEIARPAWAQLRAEAVALVAAGQIFDPLERARLIEIDRRARRLDEAMLRLLAEPPGRPGGGVVAVLSELAPLVALVARSVL